MKRNIRKTLVRYNLSRGVNYMKWKITYPDKSFEYREPSETSLIMTNCFLRNQSGTANKIYNGSYKTVCAWIECEAIEILNIFEDESPYSKRISYNPKTKPYWRYNDENIDSTIYDEIFTIDRKIFIK